MAGFSRLVNTEHFTEDGYNVANLWHNKFTATPERIAEQDAYAALLTASPALLEACEAALGNARGWRAMMRRAVKAAKGGA